MGQRKASFIGLDIGGTKMEGVFWRSGKVLTYRKAKTPRTKLAFLKTFFNLAWELQKFGKPQGLGVALAGAIDHHRGVILKSPNLRFLNGVNFRKVLEKKFRVPVKLENDTNCFLLAELLFGHARGRANVVGLTLGTGVGGAVCLDGKLIFGRHGSAGELGHIITAGGDGKYYTIEDLVSSHGFLRFGVKDPLLWQRRAEAGDKKARALYDKIGGYLGLGLASLVGIFDPELIVLGGGIARAGKLLLLPATKMMQKYALLPKKELPPVKVTRLNPAGALGAVALFLRK